MPYLRYVKQASGGRTFTVFLKDPRTGPKAADFIWAPELRPLRGTECPHHPHAAAPDLARSASRPRAPRPTRALPRCRIPRVAVLAGGDSRHHRFTDG